MDSRKISIVIPAYNAGAFIREAIESALSQTYPEKEILVIDDGSTDDTLMIAESYMGHGVIVLRNGVNRGANYTYNYGVLHATGTYLTFLDADDVLLPTYCEKVIERMEAERADIGFADLFTIEGTIRQNMRLYGQPRHPKYLSIFGGPDGVFPQGDPVTLRRWILQGVHVSPRSVYRRRLFLDYGMEDMRLRIAHDWLRHIVFILHGATCAFVAEPLGYYRIHGGGNSQRDPIATLFETVKTTEIVLTDYGHLLSPDERQIVVSMRNTIRSQLFTILANSEFSNREILYFLLERKFGL
ncbi:MAG: glycosyltransferase family 2 protein [Thermoflavifilum sp.]|nr:glycosyltransferase family 2 protein [Thermoflavifilum sp.]MCL6515273.1 glycosyltransferase [Alicyclobacillus sp.]